MVRFCDITNLLLVVGVDQKLPSAMFSTDTTTSKASLLAMVFLAEHKGTREVYAIKSLKKDLIIQEDDNLNEQKVLETSIPHWSPLLLPD